MGGFVASRIGKPLLMFLITFFAVRYITNSSVSGVVVGLVPALLGATNTYASFGYTITAASLVCAVVFAVIPHSIKDPIASMVSQSVNELAHPNQQGASSQPQAVTTTQKSTTTAEKKTNSK